MNKRSEDVDQYQPRSHDSRVSVSGSDANLNTTNDLPLDCIHQIMLFREFFLSPQRQ